MQALKRGLSPLVIVSPGIEPGYIVFPSHKKQCVYIGVLLLYETLKISSSAPGLGLMTHR
jgi:hypothetical protein